LLPDAAQMVEVSPLVTTLAKPIGFIFAALVFDDATRLIS
jgi:hypothetical protein